MFIAHRFQLFHTLARDHPPFLSTSSMHKEAIWTGGIDALPVDFARLYVNSFSTNNLLDEQRNYHGPLTLGAAAHGYPVNVQGTFWPQDQAVISSIILMGSSLDGNGLSVWNNNSN